MVLPTLVVTAAAATEETCPEAPFCLWPLPAHSCVSGYHLWPLEGRGGRLPQEQTNGSGHMQLVGAASLPDDFVDDFPMVETITEVAALLDYEEEAILLR